MIISKALDNNIIKNVRVFIVLYISKLLVITSSKWDAKATRLEGKLKSTRRSILLRKLKWSCRKEINVAHFVPRLIIRRFFTWTVASTRFVRDPWDAISATWPPSAPPTRSPSPRLCRSCIILSGGRWSICRKPWSCTCGIWRTPAEWRLSTEEPLFKPMFLRRMWMMTKIHTKSIGGQGKPIGWVKWDPYPATWMWMTWMWTRFSRDVCWKYIVGTVVIV